MKKKERLEIPIFSTPSYCNFLVTPGIGRVKDRFFVAESGGKNPSAFAKLQFVEGRKSRGECSGRTGTTRCRWRRKRRT